MKTQIILITYSLILFSCNSNQNDSKTIENKQELVNTKNSNSKNNYLYTKTCTGTAKGNSDVKVVTDPVTIFSSDYFEVGLYIMGDNESYTAQKTLQEPVVGEDFKSITLYMTDKNGNIINFKSTTDFLNFMSEHNYDLVDQTKSKYRTDYTFKKKS